MTWARVSKQVQGWRQYSLDALMHACCTSASGLAVNERDWYIHPNYLCGEPICWLVEGAREALSHQGNTAFTEAVTVEL
jgi:hypothetical protein